MGEETLLAGIRIMNQWMRETESFEDVNLHWIWFNYKIDMVREYITAVRNKA